MEVLKWVDISSNIKVNGGIKMGLDIPPSSIRMAKCQCKMQTWIRNYVNIDGILSPDNMNCIGNVCILGLEGEYTASGECFSKPNLNNVSRKLPSLPDVYIHMLYVIHI